MENLPDDQPPIFKTWRAVYIFVLSFYTLLIAFFYFFTRAYA